MLKSDINGSMLFKIRGYGMAVLLEKRACVKDLVFYNKDKIGNTGGICSLKSQEENLTYKGGKMFDVMAIKQYESLSAAIGQMLSEKEPIWDWERDGAEEMTLAQIEKALGKKIKIVNM